MGDYLVEHVFAERPGSVVAAASSILSGVIFNAYVAPKTNGQGEQTPSNRTLSPMTPPSLTLGVDDIVNVGVDLDPTEMSLDEGMVKTPARLAVQPSTEAGLCSTPKSRSDSTDPQWFEGQGNVLLREICQHLPARARGFLDNVLSREKIEMSTPMGVVNALGSTPLEVVNLLTMLVRTGSAMILEALLREAILPRCLKLFFRHPWNNLLHNSVRGLLSEVLSGYDSERPGLTVALLQEGGVIDLIVAAYSAEQELKDLRQTGIRQRHSRVGYMGHLHQICCQLREYATQVPQVADALGVEGWENVVLPAVDATTKLMVEQMEGIRMDASSACWMPK